MSPYYTGKGDDGTTGLLGEGRVSKSDLRLETLGSLDEASAALGLARSLMKSSKLSAVVIQMQRDLYLLMAEVSATAENTARFSKIDAVRVSWVEQQIETIGRGTNLPDEFIVPGDTLSGASMSLARATVRRAERRLVELVKAGQFGNKQALAYINRLSSLCFVLEVHEINAGRSAPPTPAKKTSI